jgi:hypothetical protein
MPNFKAMEDIIKNVQDKIIQKEAELNELRNDLKVILKYSEVAKKGFSTTHAKASTPQSSVTFDEAILAMIKDRKARTARTLLSEYIVRYNKPDYKYSTFSARLSNMVKKSKVKKHDRGKGVSVTQKFWYGLPDMFTNSTLNIQYQMW